MHNFGLEIINRKFIYKLLHIMLQEGKSKSSLGGLVLAGGFSERMGQDKSQLLINQQIQWKRQVDLLAQYGDLVCISCRKEQKENFEGMICIEDQYEGIGPMGGLLSAWKTYKEWAWMVLACDMPLMDQATLSYLYKHRNREKMVTALRHPKTKMIEPLVAIWEPEAYVGLLAASERGAYSLKKYIVSVEGCLLDAPQESSLFNLNTEEELKKIRTYFDPENL